MKNILLLLLLAITPLRAQIPPPGPAAPSSPALPGGPEASAPPAQDGGVIAITPTQKANLSDAALNRMYGKDEINFKEVDINQFLTVYADLVNRTILRPSSLPAPTITLRNQTPITRREAIQLFDAVLGINGIAIINVGEKFAKAVPVAQANQEGAAFSRGGAASIPELGSYVTHVVQLKYTRPSELVPVLQPFAKIPNAILPIEANGILVIRDYSENVKRMLEMIAQVDVSVPAEYISEVIPIKYALAADIASALNSLGGSGGASVGGGAAGGASRTGAARGAGGRTGFGTGMGVSGGGYGGAAANPQGGVLGTPGAQGAAGGGGTFTDRLRSIINKASGTGGGGAGDIQIIGTNKIIADERTNSLLVYATRQDMATIKDVISKLDVVLAQVLIESIILGVDADKSWELGVSAAQRPKNIGSDVQTAGIMNNDKGNLLSDLSSIILSNSVASLPGLNYFGQINQDWLVAIKALSQKTKTEVLQRPVIMTTHATPGQFFVGNTVPYVTSSYYGGGYGGVGPSSSYQQLRVGIQLNVTPFINPDGIVVMKIDQAIEEISGHTTITGVGDVPNTASRTLSADITVRDRDTLVLGGFIRAANTKTKSGVPLLKDIPLLGYLFSNNSDDKARQELLVLMRPTVLKTPELAAIGSQIERDRLRGVSRFEKQLKKDDAEFDKEMDSLDGVKTQPQSAAPPQTPAADKQSQALQNALREAQTPPENSTPKAAPPTQVPQTAPPSTPAQPTPVPQSAPPQTLAPKPARADSQKSSSKNTFNSVQPMTEDEMKAFGRTS